MRWTVSGLVVGVLAVVVGAVMRWGGSEVVEREYPQATPEASLEAVYEMVLAGDAGRLPELIHSESAAMRGALDDLAVLCRELQELAEAASEVFPEESVRLSAVMRADPGAAFGAIRPRGGNLDPTAGPARDSLRLLLADPYGWILAERERLSVAVIDDSRAAVLRDGRPVFGIGMLMRRGEDERWRVELPLRIPGGARFTPQNDDEWRIVGSMLRVFAGAVEELEGDLRSGRARDMSDAARLAGEKALGPVVLVSIAYRQALEARAGSRVGR